MIVALIHITHCSGQLESGRLRIHVILEATGTIFLKFMQRNFELGIFIRAVYRRLFHVEQTAAVINHLFTDGDKSKAPGNTWSVLLSGLYRLVICLNTFINVVHRRAWTVLTRYLCPLPVTVKGVDEILNEACIWRTESVLVFPNCGQAVIHHQ